MIVKLFPFLLLLQTQMRTSEAILKVHQNLDQCQKQGSVSLRCDFKYTEESVLLEPDFYPPGSTPIEVIYIHNVKTLTIPKPICADMTFENVDRITLNPNAQCPKRLMTLKLINSQINDVPRQLDRLEVTGSNVERLICDKGLRKFLISESSIGEFRLPWPMAGDITLKIEHSKIERFMEMKLEEKIFLIVSNTTINYMPHSALYIGSGAAANFWYSAATGAENSIILKEGAKFSVKQHSGVLYTSVSKSGQDDMKGKRPPGVPQPKFPGDDDDENEAEQGKYQQKCRNRTTPLLLWLIPTLIATAEAFILITWCGLSSKNNKRKNARNSESHSQSAMYNSVQIEGLDQFGNNYPASYNPNDPNAFPYIRKR